MQIAILPVTELNLDVIAPAVEALRELPLDTINVGPALVHRRRDVGADYERVMREEFGIAATSWKGFDFDWNAVAATKEQQMLELVKLLKGLKRRRFLDSTLGRPWTSFVPDVPAERVPEYFSNFGETFGHDLCPVAWYFAQVEPDGEVTLLRRLPGLLHRQRAQAAVPGDLDGGEGAAVPREAREGAAAHLRALLRELRVREVGAPVTARALWRRESGARSAAHPGGASPPTARGGLSQNR